MRITCPSCAATYDVPATRLSSGKMIRCARCGAEWIHRQDALPVRRAELQQDAPTPLTEPDEAVSLVQLRHATDAGQESGGKLRAAWIASVLVLAILLCATVVWRNSIMAAWPPSARVLAWIGTPTHNASTTGTGTK